MNHDKEVPFRLLKKVKSVSVGSNSQNLIIHGDNLEALKALMPHYAGKVKCIYIDPPYNTGNEGWVYNDKVNSPKIRQWLGKVVGGEGEDLTRHDKWLSMIYPRLKLLRDFLSDDGVIFISIGDDEHCNLRVVLDEIFQEKNFVANFIWKNKLGGGNDSSVLVTEHEYIVVFAKDIGKVKKFTEANVDNGKYIYEDEYVETRGKFAVEALYRSSIQYSDSLFYPIETPDGTQIYPNESDKDSKKHIWRWSRATFEKKKKEGRVLFKNTKNGWRVFSKQYFLEDDDGNQRVLSMRSIIDFIGNRQGTELLKSLFNNEKIFDNPKPVPLIKKLIELSTNKDDIVLDSFAGSGTTGHAVLDLNKEDGGGRRFILVEMEDEIAEDITAERIKRAINKYGYKDGFDFCELDKPLFDESGQIEKTCDFKQFATYLYFTETQSNIDSSKIKGSFIGEANGAEYYLVFKGINKNTLNKTFLKNLKKNNNKKVVYADRCTLDEDLLMEYNIVFKQIPYEVTVY